MRARMSIEAILVVLWLLGAIGVGKVFGIGSGLIVAVCPPAVFYLGPLAVRRVYRRARGLPDHA